MNNPNVNRIWKDRAELETFRNIERLVAWQMGVTPPLFFRVR